MLHFACMSGRTWQACSAWRRARTGALWLGLDEELGLRQGLLGALSQGTLLRLRASPKGLEVPGLRGAFVTRGFAWAPAGFWWALGGLWAPARRRQR